MPGALTPLKQKYLKAIVPYFSTATTSACSHRTAPVLVQTVRQWTQDINIERNSCAYPPRYWVNTKIKSEKKKVVEGWVNAHCTRGAAVGMPSLFPI